MTIWLVGWFYGMSNFVGLFNVEVIFCQQLYGFKCPMMIIICKQLQLQVTFLIIIIIIDKMQQNNKREQCGDRDETINQKISKCSKLAQNSVRLDVTGWEDDPQGIVQEIIRTSDICTTQNPSKRMRCTNVSVIQTDLEIDQEIVDNKKENLTNSGLCRPSKPQKETEKKNKYLDLAIELKTMKHENDGDTNCYWCTWNNP